MELFKLFGSIFVDNENANKQIAETDKKAEKTGGTFSKMIGTVGKLGLAVGATVGAFAVGMGVKAFNATEDLNKALNGLQAQTGDSKETMDGMKDAMLDIYNNNFGESFEDIGKAMATIRQQTGLANEELATTTKNAIAIKDTFGIEVEESIRAVNAMMKNFGISSEEAYNLLAQGAQMGLNQNQDLADQLSEYSVYYNQLGISAQDAFNMLVSGAEQGIYQIDYLNDAVKEFGIRVKDNSDTTNESFTLLGLNAQDISMAFAKGGESASNAFTLVNQKLSEIQDPLLQNQIGVGLYGTKWEDVGSKGVLALSNVSDLIDKNRDALKQINEVKYNTFGEAMTGIGRQLETSIFIPMGEKILPIMNRFASWINENMPAIKEVISTTFGVIEKVFNIVYDFIDKNIMPIFNELTTSTDMNFDSIKTIIDDVVTFLLETVFPPFQEWLEYLYQEILPILVNAFKEWFPKIAKIIGDTWTIVKAILTDLKAVFDFVFPYIKVLVSGIIEAIVQVIGGVITVLEGVIEFLAGAFSGNWEKLWNGIITIVKGIFQTFFGVDIIEIGKNIVKGLWQGINDMAGWIRDKVYGFISSIGSTIKSFFGISSPSKLTASYGKNIAEGLAKGILDNTKKVEDATNKMIGDIDSNVNINAQGNSNLQNAPFMASDKILGSNNISNAKTNIYLTVTGNSIMNDRDADRLGDLLVGRLKALGAV